MKRCAKCGKEKDHAEFSKGPNKKDGLRLWCRKCGSEAKREYHLKNRARMLRMSREYYEKNKRRLIAISMAYHNANREKVAAQRAAYYKANPEKRSDYRKKNRVHRNATRILRRKNDPMFAVSARLRNRIFLAFNGKGWTKCGSSLDLIGCTFLEMKQHIESLFVGEMSWENKGRWHIDHIIPLASAKTPEEMAVLCKYTNLQPLWSMDNLKKGAKMPIA